MNKKLSEKYLIASGMLCYDCQGFKKDWKEPENLI
jgi:hypothetical protein